MMMYDGIAASAPSSIAAGGETNPQAGVMPTQPTTTAVAAPIAVIRRSASIRSAGVVVLIVGSAARRRSCAWIVHELVRSVNSARSWAEPVGASTPTTRYAKSV